MLKKILPVIIITVCLLFAGCKAPADQEQKNNTETAVLSTETQEEDWKQVHSTQKDLEKLPQKIQKIFSDNQTFFDVEKGKELLRKITNTDLDIRGFYFERPSLNDIFIERLGD